VLDGRTAGRAGAAYRLVARSADRFLARLHRLLRLQ
jgi:hypothetical protein